MVLLDVSAFVFRKYLQMMMILELSLQSQRASLHFLPSGVCLLLYILWRRGTRGGTGSARTLTVCCGVTMSTPVRSCSAGSSRVFVQHVPQDARLDLEAAATPQIRCAPQTLPGPFTWTQGSPEESQRLYWFMMQR